jgi:HSP20 family protein
MSLEKWDPFKELVYIQKRMNQLMSSTCDFPQRSSCWCPAVDILETPRSFIVRVELPGVGRDNVNIELKANHLRVYGVRPEPEQGQGIWAYRSCERVNGPFERNFSLPGNIDPENVEASYEDGVLEILIPKTSENRDRHIEVVCAG